MRKSHARALEILERDLKARGAARRILKALLPAARRFLPAVDKRPEEITTEECAPVAGLRFTNDMSFAIGQVRDSHIVRTIADLMNERSSSEMGTVPSSAGLCWNKISPSDDRIRSTMVGRTILPPLARHAVMTAIWIGVATR